MTVLFIIAIVVYWAILSVLATFTVVMAFALIWLTIKEVLWGP